MTQRNRRRQRRRGGIGGKLLLVGGGVFALIAIAVIAVTSWVLDVAADAPSLATCKPIDRGGNSALYAADGSKLGRDRLRRGAHAGLDRAHPEEPAAGDGGDRGPALLRARRRSTPRGSLRAALKDLEAGEAVEGGSTITQQLVRNLCIANPERNLERKIVEAKLAIEYAERHSPPGNPRLLPQHRLLRDDRGQHRGRGPGAPRRSTSRQAGLEADPAAGGAAGRPAAGALRIQPDPQPARRRGRAATRCCAKMAKLGYVADERAPRRPSSAASGSTSPTATSSTASPTSSTTSRTS